MAHDHAVAHHTSADDEYLETPPDAGHEHTDANVWTIVKFGIWLAISAIVVHFGLGLMYQMLIEQAKDMRPPQYPLAAGQDPRLPPDPKLQQFPEGDMYRYRLTEQERLHSFGWVNKEAGSVHIPIEDAMRLTVERGLPSRTETAVQPQDAPGMLASDASSGRLMERRR